MECRSCGTTIAEKAIVCFRCGTPTATPARASPVASPRRAARGWPAPAIALVIVAALIWAVVAIPEPSSARTMGLGLGGAAVVALLGWLAWALTHRHRVN